MIPPINPIFISSEPPSTPTTEGPQRSPCMTTPSAASLPQKRTEDIIHAFRGSLDAFFHDHASFGSTFADPKARKQLLIRAIAAFLGDGLITGGAGENPDYNLDGMNTQQIGQLYQLVLWLCEQPGLDLLLSPSQKSLLQQQIEGLRDFQTRIDAAIDSGNAGSLTTFLEQKIETLTPGAFFSMPGGTRNHAMIYVFRGNEDGTIDLEMYNATASTLVDWEIQHPKLYISPVIVYEHITKEALLFRATDSSDLTPSPFLSYLLEFKTLHKRDPEYKSDQKNLLSATDSYSKQRHPKDWAHRGGAITPQRGGSCGAAAFKAWLRTCYCPKLETYKKAMWHWDKYMLLVAYDALAPHLHDQGESGLFARQTLSTLATNGLRRIAKVASSYTTAPLEEVQQVHDLYLYLFEEAHRAKEAYESAYALLSSQPCDPSSLPLKTAAIRNQAPPAPTRPSPTHLGHYFLADSMRGKDQASFSREVKCLKKVRPEDANRSDRQSKLICGTCSSQEYAKVEAELYLLFPCFSSLVAQLPGPTHPKFQQFWGGDWHSSLNAICDLADLLGEQIEVCFRIINSGSIRYDQQKEQNRHLEYCRTRMQCHMLFLFAIGYACIQQVDQTVSKSRGNGIADYNPGILPSFFSNILSYASKEEYERTQAAFDYLFCHLEGTHLDLDLNCKEFEVLESKIEENLPNYKYWHAYFPDRDPIFIATLESETYALKSKLKDSYPHLYHHRHLIYTVYKACNWSLYTHWLQNTEGPNKGLWCFSRRGSPRFSSYDAYGLEHAQRTLRKHEKSRAEAECLSNLYRDPSLRYAALRWKLAPHNLLSFIEKSYSKLSGISFRSWLLDQLFISPMTESHPRPSPSSTAGQLKIRLGIGALITENGCLVDQVARVVREGSSYFQQVNQPEISAFFLRIAFLLARYLHEAGHAYEALDQSRFIESWLAQKDVPPETAGLLHLYRFLFLSLNSTPKTPEAWGSWYGSWVIANTYMPQRYCESVMLMVGGEIALSATLSLQASLAVETTLRHAIGEGIATTLSRYHPLAHDELWAYKATNLLKNPASSLTIDLVAGKLETENGIVSEGGEIPRALQVLWQRVSPTDSLPSLLKAGEYLVFNDRYGNRYRFLNGSGLERYFVSESAWGHYHEPCAPVERNPQREKEQRAHPAVIDAIGEQVPSALRHDHACWVLTDKILITRLTTQEVRYTIAGDTIHLVGSEEKRSVSSLEAYEDTPTKKALSAIELPDEILLVRNANQEIVEIHYPCLSSFTGAPLSFFRNSKGQFIWSQNCHYCLAPQAPGGILGRLPHLLTLDPLRPGEPQKLVVPWREVQASGNALPSDTVMCNLLAPQLEIEKSGEGDKTVGYFEYDLSGRDIIPKSMEGRCYLAYLFLSQKAFGRAIHQLRGLEKYETLSKAAEEILWMIVALDAKSDDHPNGIMVSQYAIYRLIQAAYIKSENSEIFIFHNSCRAPLLRSCLQRALNYLNNRPNIDAVCRFREDEERCFLDQIHHEAHRNYYDYKTELAAFFPYFSNLNRSSVPRTDLSHIQKYACEDNQEWKHGTRPFTDYPYSPKYEKGGPCCAYYFWYEGNLDLLQACIETAKGADLYARRRLVFRLHLLRQDRSHPHLDWMLSLLINPAHWNLEAVETWMHSKETPTLNLKTWEKWNSGTPSFFSQRAEALTEMITQFLVPDMPAPPHNPSPDIPYPTATRSKLDRPREVGEATPLSPSPPPVALQQERVQFWSGWKQQLIRRDSEKTPVCPFDATYDSMPMEDIDADHRSLVKTEWKAFLAKGRAYKNPLPALVPALPNTQIREMQQTLTTVQEQNDTCLKALSASLEADLHTLPTQKEKILLEKARREAGVEAPTTFDDALQALLEGNTQAFRRLNPYLDDGMITHIATQILEIEYRRSYTAQLQQAQDLLSKLSRAASDAEREDLIRRLYTLCHACHEIPSDNQEFATLFTIFAGERGQVPYSSQVEAITFFLHRAAEESYDGVKALMMGGGKTSVIAPLLLYTLARKRTAPVFFVVPEALFETVSHNLTDTLSAAFRTAPYPFHVSSQELTEARLQRIWHQVQGAQQRGEVILTTGETMRLLELSWIYAYTQNPSHSPKRLTLLSHLCRWMRSGIALIDEVDLAWRADRDVILSFGPNQAIDPEDNALVHQLFSLLVRKDIMLEEGISLAEALPLEKNEQDTLSPTRYYQSVLPALVAHLMQEPPNLLKSLFEGRHRESIRRYLCDEIAHEYQNQADHPMEEDKPYPDDVLFLQHLASLRDSQHDADRQAVRRLATLRHLLLDLLPQALSKNGNRHFGYKDKRIVPYRGVGTPDTTEYQRNIEEAVYAYMMCLMCPETIILESVKEYAEDYKKYTTHSNYSNEQNPSDRFQREWQATPEDVIYFPNRRQMARDHFITSPHRRLYFQAWHNAKYIASRQERVVSTASDHALQVSHRMAMSGTPWNFEGYLSSVRTHYEEDNDVYGIAWAFAERQSPKVCVTHVTTMKQFLSQVTSQIPPIQSARLCGVIDTGGMFKSLKQTQEEMLADLLAHFTAFQYLLFFSGDTLCARKRGSEEVLVLEGSSRAALEQAGISPHDSFFFIDERHSTGTDLPQPPEAINLITYDSGMMLRTWEQGALRLRQLLTTQDWILVVPEALKAASYRDLIFRAVSNQTLHKANMMIQHYLHQIRALFRGRAIQRLLEQTDYDATTCSRYKAFICDKPLNRVISERLPSSMNTKAALCALLEQKYQDFPDQDPELLQEVESLKSVIIEATWFPEQTHSLDDRLGAAGEVTTLSENTVEVQAKAEAYADVYAQARDWTLSLYPLEEPKLTVSKLFTRPPKTLGARLLSEMCTPNDPPPVSLLPDALETPFYGTRAFFNPFRDRVPLLHPNHRPIQHVLVVEREEGVRNWILLSQYETQRAWNALKKDPKPQNIWLIDIQGHPLVDPASPFPIDEPTVASALLELRIVAGDPTVCSSPLLRHWIADRPEQREPLIYLRFPKAREWLQTLDTSNPIHATLSIPEPSDLVNSIISETPAPTEPYRESPEPSSISTPPPIPTTPTNSDKTNTCTSNDPVPKALLTPETPHTEVTPPHPTPPPISTTHTDCATPPPAPTEPYRESPEPSSTSTLPSPSLTTHTDAPPSPNCVSENQVTPPHPLSPILPSVTTISQTTPKQSYSNLTARTCVIALAILAGSLVMAGGISLIACHFCLLDASWSLVHLLRSSVGLGMGITVLGVGGISSGLGLLALWKRRWQPLSKACC